MAKKKITGYTVQHRNGDKKISSGSRGLTNREPFERLRSAEDVKENQMSSLNRVTAATMRDMDGKRNGTGSSH